MPKKRTDLPQADPKQLAELITPADIVRIAEAWTEYQGPIEVFESAVGAFVFGRFAGFDALRVVHGSRTLRNYERILGGIAFKDTFPKRTAESRRVNGIRYAEKFQDFWRALAAGVSSTPGAKDAGLATE